MTIPGTKKKLYSKDIRTERASYIGVTEQLKSEKQKGDRVK
jgi:hypothetical protein